MLKLLIYTFIIFSLGSFFSMTICKADELIIYGASKHSDDFYYDSITNEKKQYNESNPGLGYGFDYSDNIQLRAGFYDNSYHRFSVLSGFLAHNATGFNNIRYGVFVGAVTGYAGTTSLAPQIKNVSFIALPTLRYQSKNITAEIGAIPDLLTFNLGVRF